VIEKEPRIALLPGSRKSEIRHHAPILRGLIDLIKKEYPKAQIRVPIANTLSTSWVSEKIGLKPAEVSEDSWETLQWADVAVVASGTATLETALIGTPFCLFYKVSPSSSWLFRNLIKYQGFIGMPNILLGREVVKECFQENASAQKLFSEIKFMINSGLSRLNMASSLLSCRQLLGEKGDQTRAASRVVENLKKSRAISNQGSYGSPRS
jgi:lipid-A-disaccharide synthase